MNWKRVISWISLGFLLSLPVLPALLVSEPFAVLGTICFGWLGFLKQNFPQITFNWSLISTGVICSVFVLLLGNWLLGTLYRQIQIGSRPERSPRKWRWQWTLGLYAATWILFAISVGAAGVWQHTAWLLNDNHPWYERRRLAYVELSFADDRIMKSASESDGDLERTRKALRAQSSPYSPGNMYFEDFDVIFYGDSSNKLEAYLIIPRDARLTAKGRFAIINPDSRDFLAPLSKLPQIVAEMDAKYPAKIGP